MTSSSAASTTRALLAEQTLLDGRFQPNVAVLIDGGRISGVQLADSLPPDVTVERYPRRLLVPGTINAHNHSFQSMLRGIADDCNFFTWRDRALYGYTPYMDEQTVYAGALFAFAEMLRAGVTTVCDFFYIHRDGNANDHAVIRAARDLGMRIVLARTMYDWEGAPIEYRESIPDAVARTRELWQTYRGNDDV
ncbi:MAG TPA: amidohydrolase family protein, partial [Ktedonobacterales bacterium]|nr:amidohydrolase family protein [Ktedonobacterales bacterium]